MLDLADAVSYRDGFQGGFDGGEFGFLGGAEDSAVEEPLVGGVGLVVASFLTAEGVGVPADGFLWSATRFVGSNKNLACGLGCRISCFQF